MLQDICEIQSNNTDIFYLQKLIKKLADKCIAIYGTGKQTEKLLNQLDEDSASIQFLIDRDEEVVNHSKYGKQIINLETAIKNNVKLIIISSAFEEEIYKRIKNVEKIGITVIRLKNEEFILDANKYKLKKIKEIAKQAKSYTFIDRRKVGNTKLLIILAGYKQYLWPYTLGRVKEYVPSDIDVCILSSGVYSKELDEMSRINSWSYLHSNFNEVSLIQNIAIMEHPNAEWIFKMDEDIFISPNYCINMINGYEKIAAEGLYNPGFVAPLININGFSYIEFLRYLKLENEYRDVFGELRYSANNIKCHYDPEAAKYLWAQSLPFEKIAKKFNEKEFQYSVVPHRFSIGSILMKREFWMSIGGLKVSGYEGILGVDEKQLCQECMENSRAMCVINNILCGHFSFFHQEEGMIKYLDENQELFKIAT